MTDQKDPLLLDHEADGIRELDNNLPRWWVWLFYISIVISVVYMLYFHVLGMGKLSAAEYEAEMEVGDKIKQASLAKFEATMSELTPSEDPGKIADGENTFLQLCAPCHRVDGGGVVGPNLTDDYWIHGDSFVDSLQVIWNGVPEKGMVTWKGVLKPEEIQNVASYIYTLRGTQPPNPKPPESAGAAAAPEENLYE